MKNLVWLSSYPKSGNTWLRVFLDNLFNTTDGPQNINKLVGTSFSGNRAMIDEIGGVSTSDLSDNEIEDIQGEVFRQISRDRKSKLYLKTHDSFRLKATGERFFPEGVTAATIYLVRSPLDVVVSFAYHENRPVSEMIKVLSDKSYSVGGNAKRMVGQVNQPIGHWSHHVSDWLNAPADMNLLLLRYEDMVHKPIETFTRAVHFLKLDVSDAEVQNALSKSDFRILQSQEKKEGFVEKSRRSKVFFRKGITGDWQNELTEIQVQKIIDDHGEVMTKLGYLNDHGLPIVF